MAKSNSSIKQLDYYRKIHEWTTHFCMRFRGLFTPRSFSPLFQNIEEYDIYLKKYCGLSIATCSVLEIGYGARPLRLIALTSMGINAIGVDLDRPILHGRLAEFSEMYARNGFERTLKSLIRHFAFDWQERAQLAKALATRGHQLRIFSDAFICKDATQLDLPSESLDLVISEDVFEHIQRDTLPVLIDRIASWLKPNAIALIRPCIFTGITGNHLSEWYPHTLNKPMQRRSEPWEHLRKKRHFANTYLNELTRAEFRSMFSRRFQIIEERVTTPNLGKPFLTNKIRDELSKYSDDELFSNNVLFVLRRR